MVAGVHVGWVLGRVGGPYRYVGWVGSRLGGSVAPGVGPLCRQSDQPTCCVAEHNLERCPAVPASALCFRLPAFPRPVPDLSSHPSVLVLHLTPTFVGG